MKGRDVLAEAMRRAGRDEDFIRFSINRMNLDMPSLANEDVPDYCVEEQIRTIISGHQKLVDTIDPDHIHQIYEEAKKDISSTN